MLSLLTRIARTWRYIGVRVGERARVFGKGGRLGRCIKATLLVRKDEIFATICRLYFFSEIKKHDEKQVDDLTRKRCRI